MNIEKYNKERHELNRQLNETTMRMENRKNMNGYNWDDRISCVEALKDIDRQLKQNLGY